MLSPLVSWILSPSSSSSSSSEEQSLDIDTTEESDHENDNVTDQNDHLISSCDVDDTNIPVALAVPHASPAVTVAFPAADDRNTPTTTTTTTIIVTRPKRQRINYTVRQYQRLWTKQDEVELLKGYLDYVKQHQGPTTSLQNDVALLYDQVRPKLNVGYNRNQLVEKLRRLKRKHKMALDKLNKGKNKEVSFKSPEEEAIFEISQKIWGNGGDQRVLDGDESSPITESNGLGNVKVKIEQVENCDEMENGVPKRLRLITDDGNRRDECNDGDNATSIQSFIEETMRSCFSPLMKEVLDDAQEGSLGGLAGNPMELCSGEVDDEQCRKRRILELEVYLNRLEVLQDQIKAKLEGLRSS